MAINQIPYMISTRADKSQDELINTVLDFEMTLMSQAIGYTLQHFSQTTLSDSAFKTLLSGKFNIQNHQAGYAIKQVKGMIQSRLSNVENNYLKETIENCEKSQKKTKRLIKNKDNKLNAMKIGDKNNNALFVQNKLNLRKSIQQINANHRRITRLDHQIKKYQDQLIEEKAPICLGSKNLFKQQYQLEENGFNNHEAWRKAYQMARINGIRYVGSKDETNGGRNAKMVFNGDQIDLHISLSPAAKKKFELNKLIIENVEFKRGQDDELLSLIKRDLTARIDKSKTWKKYETENKQHFEQWKDQAKQLKSLKKDKDNLVAKEKDNTKKEALVKEIKTLKQQIEAIKPYSKGTFLSGEGCALSFTFNRDVKGWRFSISYMKNMQQHVIEDQGMGWIGVDCNYNHLAFAETDQHGELVQSDSLSILHEFTQKPHEDRIWVQAQKIVDLAVKTGKPIALEKLNFSFKKRVLESVKLSQKNNSKYNYMLNSFAYNKMLTAIDRRAKVHGVTVKYVNPSYTSFIGNHLYGGLTKSIHESASYVIARRAQCTKMAKYDTSFKDKIQTLETVIGSVNYQFDMKDNVEKPEDFSACNVFRSFKTWQKKQYAMMKNGRKAMRESVYLGWWPPATIDYAKLAHENSRY